MSVQIQIEKRTTVEARHAPEAEGLGMRAAILAAVVIGLVMMLGAVGIRLPTVSASPAVVASD